MKAFATLIEHISQKPIKRDFTPYDTLLSFGYFWHTLPSCERLFILHPLFVNENKTLQSLRYEVGTEFGVAWLLAHTLSHLLNVQTPLTQELQAKLQHIDVGYLSSESNLAEEELESITQYTKSIKKPLGIVLGNELALHQNAQDIALICGILARSSQIDVIMPELADSIHSYAECEPHLQICEDLPESNGHFVYILPTHTPTNTLKIPPLFAPMLGLKDKQHITLCFESQCIEAICERDNTKKGTIALLCLPTTNDIGYPYKKVEVIL